MREITLTESSSARSSKTSYIVKSLIRKIAIAALACIAAYGVGAFAVTPPHSPHGFYSMGWCGCGYPIFITIEGNSLIEYVSGHDMRDSLGSVTKIGDIYVITGKNQPKLELRFTFWGCVATSENSKGESFYHRDFFYPLSLLTRAQAKRNAPKENLQSPNTSP